MSSNNTIDHESLGMRWLICAGTVAVLFVLFLVRMDDMLVNSTVEADRARTMREIRTAQTSLDSRVTDKRQLVVDSSDSK